MHAAEAEGRRGWLVTALPATLGQVVPMWSLTVGEPFQPGGQTAWVAPARDASGAVRLRAAHDFGDATAGGPDRRRLHFGVAVADVPDNLRGCC